MGSSGSAGLESLRECWSGAWHHWMGMGIAKRIMEEESSMALEG
jgi:hypothetical protein